MEEKNNTEEKDLRLKGFPYKDVALIIALALLIVTAFNGYIYARNNDQAFIANNRSWGGGCCSSGSENISFDTLRLEALSYYESKNGSGNYEANVEDFGCHQEIFIYDNGEMVMRLAYSGGNFYEI